MIPYSFLQILFNTGILFSYFMNSDIDTILHFIHTRAVNEISNLKSTSQIQKLREEKKKKRHQLQELKKTKIERRKKERGYESLLEFK